MVSNRLPVGITKNEGKISITPSVGGLATGLASFYKSYDSTWIGWSGIYANDFSAKEISEIKNKLLAENCCPIFLGKDEVEKYYDGFSNKTIWPLFHYFIQYSKYYGDYWEAYCKVNKMFADAVLENIKAGDKIWIHDYHLLLLPELIKKQFPDVSIGFFLHIPFPSYEVFRLLPWRKQLLEGMLGADLIGFHTFDYERHFLSCVRRILGNDTIFNKIKLEKRIVKADIFPMGIDYERFYNAAMEQQQRSIKDKTKLQKEIEKYFLFANDRKLIISIDRLDYSKGIPHRLKAYEYFLENNMEFHEKVSLILLAVPSREDVEHYQKIKSEVDKLVGRINGKYGVINWTPIWYFYRSMPFEDVIGLYSSSDIALITPIRDGMNLVAKEFIATKTNKKGVLILSEMAGAAREMSESIIVNPNNKEELADAIKLALTMSEEEQIERNITLQKRLKRYNVEKWANDFMDSLTKIKDIQKKQLIKKLTKRREEKIISAYKNAKRRILFFDYDGTLIEFRKNPLHAKPDTELLEILDRIIKEKGNKVVIISGRERQSLTKWFVGKNLTIIAEHGVWIKKQGEEWEITEKLNSDWKEIIRPILEMYKDRTPDSFIEEKSFSLVWHYRKADPDLGSLRSRELKDELMNMIANLNLEILEGSKVIEIKTIGINKGKAALKEIGSKNYDFILGIGDDWTDEYLFESLPENAHTIKVGVVNTKAKYNIETVKDVRNFLKKLHAKNSTIV